MSQRDPHSSQLSPAAGRASLAVKDTRWAALFVLCTGFLMIVLDSAIVNVALPSIQGDLGFTQANLAWVINSYLIALGGLLLLAGRLGDLIGRKRMFLAGLVAFTAASALCGLATSQEMLIAARFIQGIGGAMCSAVILGMIVTMFPEPADQAKALGVYGSVAAAGASLGLLLSGVLTQAISWHWIFLVNLPIGVVTFVLGMRLIDNDRGIGLKAGADVLGAVLVTGALMLTVYTIVHAGEHGWAASSTIRLAAASLTLLVAFVWREATARQPLLALGIFRSPNLSGANGVQMLMVAGMYGMFFVGTLYMQFVLGYDPIHIGLAFFPISTTIGLLSMFLSARLVTRFGPKPILLISLVLCAAGLALFARAPVDATYLRDLLPSMALMGIGAGIGFPGLMALAMADTGPSDAGLASGLANTTGQVGGALGVSILAALASSHTAALTAAGTATTEALTGGYHLAIGTGAGFMVAALAVAAVVLRNPKASAPHSHH